MKIIGGLRLAFLAGVFIAVAVLFGNTNNVSAEACTNTSTFGSVSLSVPTLPNDGEVSMWVRMQSPSADAKVLIEINGKNCLEVSGSELSTNTWSWQPYTSSSNPKTINFGNNSGNQIKIIGVQDGVKVDKVLFTSKKCVPQDFGDNCIEAAEAQARQTDSETITKLVSPSNQSISGEIQLTSTPTKHSSDLRYVEYVVEGKVVQKSEVPAEFDTTRLVNGKHTVLIETTLSDGTIIRESTVIEVRNSINPLSPIIRWAKINSNTFKIIAYSLGALILIGLIFGILRRWVMKRRERRFHGF